LPIRRRSIVKSLAGLPLAAGAAAGAEFRSSFDGGPRPWPGPAYWSNPLQDWRVAGGRLECVAAGGDRNVYLLTRELAPAAGSFEMSVRAGKLDSAVLEEGWVGFRVGVRGYFQDYRDSALRGLGLECGVTADGRLFIGDVTPDAPRLTSLDDVALRLEARPQGATYLMTLHAGGARMTRADVPPAWLEGGLALVCHSGPMRSSPPAIAAPTEGNGGLKWGTARGGSLRFWFRDWAVSGSKVVARDERAWGPILFTQYTVTRGVLKMTAQLAPVEDFASGALLQVRRGATWETAARAAVDPDSCTARFRVESWDARRDMPYRVVFGDASYEGVIAHDPVEKTKIVIGALTCQNDHGFPHAPIARNLAHIKPDILFFTGDQIYERSGEYGIQRAPAVAARLDYLRKWFLFGWAWGELTRRIPCVCLPDDHDVYHGNIWGAAGRKAEGQGPAGQDSGGYTMPAEWVNLVQRTQSSHLPDPPDPAPVDQNIAVHYGHLLWGGISFALLEDRKWKSAPASLLPEAKIFNGWPQNPHWRAADHPDVPGAQLLGERQERFLEEWSRDWKGAKMKAAVSATIFCNLATLPASAMSDAVVPKLAVLAPGEYPPDDKTVMDHDSNGWPQAGRNRALLLLSRCLALHIAGDQHLPSTLQYGIAEFGDASWAICTPAISNIFPRRWYPPSRNQFGNHLDGFGNRITVRAVANPLRYGVTPAALNNRAPGFGVVTMDKAARTIELVNWPRWADVSRADAKPFPGWPVRIAQADNGMSAAPFTLGAVSAKVEDAAVEVRSRKDGAVVRCWRMAGKSCEPLVWSEGEYDVRVYDPDGAWSAQVVRRAVKRS